MKRIAMVLMIIIGLFIITPSGAFAQADVAICEGPPPSLRYEGDSNNVKLKW